MAKKETTYICKVNGTFKRGHQMGICGAIGCGTNKCHSEEPCKYKVKGEVKHG